MPDLETTDVDDDVFDSSTYPDAPTDTDADGDSDDISTGVSGSWDVDTPTVTPGSGSGEGVDPCESFDPFDLIQCAANALKGSATSIGQGAASVVKDVGTAAVTAAKPVSTEANFLIIAVIVGIVAIILILSVYGANIGKFVKVNAIA
jgi:hypothetical protein